MESTDKNLTIQESLQIITTMIHEAKGSVKRNSFYLLLWGWVVVIANFGMFTLIQMHYSKPYLVWLIAIPAWLASFYKGFKDSREATTITHLGTIIMWLWISFGIIITTIIFFGSKINYQISPLVLLITAIPTLGCGAVTRFRPLVIGGIIFWVAGIIAFLLPLPFQPLVSAIAFIAGYLLPGYLIRNSHS